MYVLVSYKLGRGIDDRSKKIVFSTDRTLIILGYDR